MKSLKIVKYGMLGLYFNNKGWVKVSKSKFCSNCGNAIQGNNKFCGGCGQTVQKSLTGAQASSSAKSKSKFPHLIINIVFALFILGMGKLVEDVIIRGGGLEDILIVPVLIISLQIAVFYFQTKQKSYYPIIPVIASLWVVITHTLELIVLKEFIDMYQGIDSSDYVGEIVLLIVTIFGFAFLIVVNIISMFLKNKSLQSTTRKKVS